MSEQRFVQRRFSRIRDVRFGSKVVQFGPNTDKSGKFDLKKFQDLSHFGAISGLLLSLTRHPCSELLTTDLLGCLVDRFDGLSVDDLCRSNGRYLVSRLSIGLHSNNVQTIHVISGRCEVQ